MAKCRIDILPSAYIAAAVLLLILPLHWILAWITAAAIHELGHILAILAFRGHIQDIKIGAFGASIAMLPLAPLPEMLCALAGPASGFLLVLLFRWFPLISLFALIQSVFNLLPLYPLDGGRTLRCALVLIAGEYRTDKIMGVLEILLFSLLLVLGVLSLVLWNLGVIPLTAALILVSRKALRKIPCKSRCLGLQ